MSGRDARMANVPTCLCGHNQRRHELAGFDGECVADGCGCRAFTPRETSTASPRPVTLGAHRQVAASGTTVAQLVAAGRSSGHKRTVAMADRLDTYARDLAARLRAERDLDALTPRVTADQAVLDRPMPPAALPVDGEARKMTVTPATCEDCGDTFPSGHAKGAHRRHKHPRAQAS